jgi:hypothetical protein
MPFLVMITVSVWSEWDRGFGLFGHTRQPSHDGTGISTQTGPTVRRIAAIETRPSITATMKAVGFLCIGLLVFAVGTPISAAEVTQTTGSGSPCSPTQNGNGNTVSCYVMPPVLPKNGAAATVLLTCEMETLPRTFGPSEVVRVLNLYPLPINTVPIADQVAGMVVDHSLAWAVNHSGKEWQWGVLGATAYKCVIENYSDAPILEVELALDLTFYDAVPAQNQPNEIAIGPQILQRPWLIEVQKIDISPHNSFSFYIYNGTENMVVRVLLPKTAKLRHLGEITRETVALDASQLGGDIPILFWPIKK